VCVKELPGVLARVSEGPIPTASELRKKARLRRHSRSSALVAVTNELMVRTQEGWKGLKLRARSWS